MAASSRRLETGPYRPRPRLKFTAEGAVEEGGEEVLGLAQRLPLHRTQTLDSLHQGRESLLEGERRIFSPRGES